jgi:hypothetical protein
MNELLITLGGLITSLGNTQNVSVVKERLAFAQDKLQQVNELVMQLQEENSRLRQQLNDAEQKLSTQVKSDEYTEYEGAFFKMKPSGGYHRAVYCPNCHVSTAPFPPGAEYNCMKCGWMSAFQENELPKIISDLMILPRPCICPKTRQVKRSPVERN